MLVNVSRPNAARQTIVNLSTYASFPLMAPSVFTADRQPGLASETVRHSRGLFVLFMTMNVLNFLLIAMDIEGRRRSASLRERANDLYMPLLPVEVAVGLLTAGVAFVYKQSGSARSASRRDLPRLPVPAPNTALQLDRAQGAA